MVKELAKLTEYEGRYDNFAKFYSDDWLEFIKTEFLTFVQEIAQITMDNYNCHYTPIVNALVVNFSYNGINYQLLKHKFNDTPEYILSLITDNIWNKFIELVKTNKFNDIKEVKL